MQKTRGRVLSHATRGAHGRAGGRRRGRGRQQRLVGREADQAWSDRLGRARASRYGRIPSRHGQSAALRRQHRPAWRAGGATAIRWAMAMPKAMAWPWTCCIRHGQMSQWLPWRRGAHAPTGTWAVDGMGWDGIGAWRAGAWVRGCVLGAVTQRPRAPAERAPLAWRVCEHVSGDCCERVPSSAALHDTVDSMRIRTMYMCRSTHVHSHTLAPPTGLQGSGGLSTRQDRHQMLVAPAALGHIPYYYATSLSPSTHTIRFHLLSFFSSPGGDSGPRQATTPPPPPPPTPSCSPTLRPPCTGRLTSPTTTWRPSCSRRLDGSEPPASSWPCSGTHTINQ